MNERVQEENKLKEILNKYEEYLDDTKLEYKNVYNLYHEQDEREERKKFLENKIASLEVNINKPYFARIDFQNKDLTDICYIGKVGITNYDNDIVTVDWRAPISSLYYDSNVGEAEYKVGEDTVEGKLLLKRQYDIENKKLISFNDVDTVSNDDLLKPYLNVSADARLKNIVSTIQSEQNEIIRSSLYKNIIVQGVAGSGKTTVALHRIAYLAYNYRDVIKNNQYMIIGPNKFFVNYISSVLPDLDVNDVTQFDLHALAQNYIHENIELEDETLVIQKYLDGNNSKLPKIKTSFAFKQIIDAYFNDYYKRAITNKPIKIKDFILIPETVIEGYWKDALNKGYDNLQSTVSRCILLLEKHLKENETNLIHKLNKFIDKKLEEGEDIVKCRKDRDYIRSEIKGSNKPLLKAYYNHLFKKATYIYKDIIKNISNYTQNKDILNEIKYEIKFEDLTPLIYINYKIYGAEEFKRFKHVVIDEAQDYNDFTFYALTKLLPSATFSIYGDLAQSIYAYRSLDNWDIVNSNVFDNKLEIKYLSKSYRTSIEIMNEANKINRHLNLKEAIPVIRHGDKVVYKNTKDKINDIKDFIRKMKDKNLKTIAIISKDIKESNNIYDNLKEEFELHNITDKNNEYQGGICTITSHLCKGLEFDAVIISDASENSYDINSDLDMKLLYVSMTRALHNLEILYKENLNKVLKD